MVLKKDNSCNKKLTTNGTKMYNHSLKTARNTQYNEYIFDVTVFKYFSLYYMK